jgi:Asp-tRNA(Asn)/Glu-tRNA(Gln) amidotransferase A subunit family amidase
MATPVPVREIGEEELRNIVVGYFEEQPDVPVTPETRAAVRRAASTLRDSGVHVEPFLPDGLSEAREHWWTLFVRLAAELLRPEFKGRESELSTILSYSDRPPTKEDLLAAWFKRDELRLRLMQQMSSTPVVICPVCSVPAFRHGEREWNLNGKRVSYMDAMAYTQWFNLLGNPAVVLPLGESPDGLPIGVQIVGQPNAEELILRVARVLEEAIGPAHVAPMSLGSIVAGA